MLVPLAQNRIAGKPHRRGAFLPPTAEGSYTIARSGDNRENPGRSRLRQAAARAGASQRQSATAVLCLPLAAGCDHIEAHRLWSPRMTDLAVTDALFFERTGMDPVRIEALVNQS